MDLDDIEETINSSFEARSVFYCTHDPTFTWDLTETVFPWVLLGIVSLASPIAVVLNVLVIIAVRTRKELHRASNILLSSMAVADILVGAISMPLSVAIDLLISRQVLLDQVCILDLVCANSMYAASGCSLFHLTAIAWERYVAIGKCYKYKVIVTRGRVKNLAIIAWFVVVLATLLYFTLGTLDVDHNIFLSPVLGVLAIILIALFYIMAYREARKRKLSQTSRVSALVKAHLENKVAMTTGLLTSALILSFVPVITIILLGEVFPTFRKSSYFRSAETLMQLNSIVNPLLYCYRDRRFRKAVLEILGLRKPQPNKLNVSAVRSARRKDSFGSLENAVKIENMQSRRSLIRSASFDLDQGVLGFQDVMLKRSVSAPSLVLDNNCCHSPQLQQPSTIVITMASIHAERPRVRDKSRKTNPSLSKYVQKNSEGKSNRIVSLLNLVENVEEEQTVAKKLRQRLSRSNSCDPAIDHPRCHETVRQRSMSVPLLGRSRIFFDSPQQQQHQ